MENALNALSTLHASTKFQRLPVLARSVTQDPHGFDQGTEQGRLLINALTLLWLQEQSSPMKDAEANLQQSAEDSLDLIAA